MFTSAFTSVIVCPFIPLSSSQQRSSDDYGVDDVITYWCQEGFRFVEDQPPYITLDCDNTGKWSGTIPQCERRH